MPYSLYNQAKSQKKDFIQNFAKPTMVPSITQNKPRLPGLGGGPVTPASPSATSPVKPSPAKQEYIQNLTQTSPQTNAMYNPNANYFATENQPTSQGTQTQMPQAPAADPRKSYTDAFASYIRSLMPTSEETAAQERLNQLRTQNRLDYEKALQSGETLGYATGLAGEQARTAAIMEGGAAESLQALTGRRQALTEAEKARLEFEKSIMPETPEGFTLGKDQVRYDAAGNPIAFGGGTTPTIRGGYVAGANPEVDAYVKMVQGGGFKLENVPQELRGAVALGLASQPATEDPKKQYVKSQADEALTNIDTALGYLSGDLSGALNTAGTAFGRAVGGFVPGSDVANLNAALDTVKALVGFDALQKMRESSPTGGALGQITERELAFLQSVQGSLNTMQGTEQLTATLNRIRQSFQTLQIVNSPDGTVFELDGQKYIKQGNQMIPTSFNSAGNASASNRPQRNNNPLNIKMSSATSTYPGVTGVDPKEASDGGKFLVFATPQDGFNAAKRLLQAPSYSNLTLDAAMKRWSGGGYGGEILPSLANKRISELTPLQLDTLIQTMAKREGFYA